MKTIKAEIHSKKQIQKDICKSEFVSSRYKDSKVVYVPVGELCGVKILAKYNVKKRGEYVILDKIK